MKCQISLKFIDFSCTTLFVKCQKSLKFVDFSSVDNTLFDPPLVFRGLAAGEAGAFRHMSVEEFHIGEADEFSGDYCTFKAEF